MGDLGHAVLRKQAHCHGSDYATVMLLGVGFVGRTY